MLSALFLLPNLAAGGQERVTSILLPGLRERGLDARLIALDAGGPFEQPLQEAGVPLEVLGMRHQADLGPLVRSPIVRRFSPDVVVSIGGPSALYIGTALARWRGAPHVYVEHRQVGFELSRRREAMMRLLDGQLDMVIAVSPEQSDVWLRRGYPPERIVVVPNGVPAHPPSGARGDVRRELGIPDSAVVALLAARLRPEKRVPDFALAVSNARASCPELIGLIAGDGPDRVAVAAAAADGAVRLLGHRDDMPRLLEAADVFVLASEFEALPMAILEAMAAGLPVLSTAVGSIPGVVEQDETGWLVPPRDPAAMAAALVALAQNGELRARLGTQARRRHAERFSAEAMIDRYAEVLQSAWAARARGRSGSRSPLRSLPGRANRKL